MKKLGIVTFLALQLVAQNPVVRQGSSPSGDVDFSNANTTKPVRTGVTLPGACTANELFFLTNVGLHQCVKGKFAAVGNGGTWGTVGGAIAAQTDLWNTLQNKQPLLTGTQSQYVRGDGSLGALAPSATTDTTDASKISSGTLPPARLPNPTATTIGGLYAAPATAHQWLSNVDSSGQQHFAQPDASDLTATVPGGVQRTQAARNADVLSAKDFGCAGDGITDDNACLVALWAASSGKSVYFPPGNYYSPGRLYQVNAASVDARGATLTGWRVTNYLAPQGLHWDGGTFDQGNDQNGGAAMYIRSNDSRVENVTFKYTGGTPAGSPVMVYKWYTAIEVAFASRVSFSNITTMTDTGSHMTITSGAFITVDGWKLYGGGEDGIAIFAQTGVTHDVVISHAVGVNVFDVLKIVNNTYPITNIRFNDWTCTNCIAPIALHGGVFNFGSLYPDGQISSGSASLCSSHASFSSDMVGNPFEVPGAGVSGGILITTIASVTDATHVTLSNAASTTVSTAVWTTRSPIMNVYVGPGHTYDYTGTEMRNAVWIQLQKGTRANNWVIDGLYGSGRFTSSAGDHPWVRIIGSEGSTLTNFRLANSSFQDTYSGSANDGSHSGFPAYAWLSAQMDAPQSKWLVENNIVNGVSGYCVQTGTTPFASADDLVFRSNLFSNCQTASPTTNAHYVNNQVRWLGNRTALNASQAEVLQAVTTSGSTVQDLQAPTVYSVPLILRDAPTGTQTGNMIEKYDSSGTRTWYISKAGVANGLTVSGAVQAVSVQTPAADVICAKGSDTAVGTQTLTGGTSTASAITVAVANTAGYTIGLTIGVTGAAPAGFNTTGVITAVVANTSITFSSSNNPGAWTSGGNVYLPCTNTADGTTATYFATQYTVPGGTFVPGVQYRVYGQFSVWTPAAGAPTISSLALAYNGGTAALNNSAVTVGNGLANFGGSAEWRMVAQSSTALICETSYISLMGATANNWVTATKQPLAANTGANANIALYTKWSSNTAGAALQLLSLTVERVN